MSVPGAMTLRNICHFLTCDWWQSRFGQWICERWTHHSAGVVWFTLHHDEPDMHCKRCGKNLA